MSGPAHEDAAPAPLIFRRPDGRLVWVCPGAPVPLLEELPTDYGALLQDVLSGALDPVGVSRPDARDALARAMQSTPPARREPAARRGRLAVIRGGGQR